jgi:flavin-dependent dehydrogenase
LQADTIMLTVCARGVGIPLMGRGGRPTITAADAAACLAGLQEKYVDAFMFRICGEDSARGRLRAALLRQAGRMSREWPKRLRSADVLARMVDLALDEDRLLVRQRSNFIRRQLLNVSRGTYYKTFHKPYGEINQEFDGWVSVAWRSIRRHWE